MARARAASEAAARQTLRLSTVLAQWEQDLQAVTPTGAVPALRFDGATLRLTREAGGGVQVVAWSRRGDAWWRWASPSVTRVAELREAWERSQQLVGGEPGTLRLLEGVGDLRLAFHRGGWANAQSSGDRPGEDTPAGQDEKLPQAVRLVLQLPEGELTRIAPVPPQP
jgi:general secretion pathway protein J